MALPWLDAARYADTDGYQFDGPRFMWRWRDWVVEALNEDMPYDRMIVEMLAADEVAPEDMDALRATGAERVISQDCGCLMNIGGAFDRQGGGPSTRHIAEFLWERTAGGEQ